MIRRCPRSRSSSSPTPRKAARWRCPGDVEAFTNAPIYAQVSGYLQKWYFDIGAKVKKGRPSGADRPQHLSGGSGPGERRAGTRQRHARQCQGGSGPLSDAGDAERDLPAAARHPAGDRQLPTPAWWIPTAPQVSQAAINLAYTRIIAPFDGIVTTRAVDVGNLVTVGTATPPRRCSPSPTRPRCASMCGCRRITRPMCVLA